MPNVSTNKFAIIETGGKQYLIKKGDKIKVEKLKKPSKGNSIIFEKVLLLVGGKDVKIGTPYLKGTKISAKIEGEVKGKKVTVLRYKSKTRYHKKKGHRQTYSKIIITDIK